MTRFTQLLLLSLLAVAAQGQTTKRALTHADYDRWQSVRFEKIANNGQWLSYQIDPQEGDGLLLVTPATSGTGAQSGNTRYGFPRGYQAQFTPDSKFLVAKVKAPYADTRKAKLKKKKPDEMPKDSLLVLNLATGQITKFANAKSATFGKDAGSTLAVLLERKDDAPRVATTTARPSASKGDTLLPSKSAGAPVAAVAPTSTSAGGAKKPVAKKPKGDDLVLLSLADGTRQTFRYVSGVAVADNGQTILFSRDSRTDSLKTGENPLPGLFRYDALTKAVSVVDTAASHKLYKNLTLDKAGQQLAWMASADSAGAEVKVYGLFYKTMAAPVLPKGRRTKQPVMADAPYRTLADTLHPAITKGFTINEFREPKFSDDGQRLYFSTSAIPPRAKKDTLTPDEEKVRMDVWNWTDTRLQPMQQRRLKEEKERGFLAVYDLPTGKITQLASREVPIVPFDPKVNTRHLLGLSDVPYQVSSSWDPGHSDLYLIDTQTGTKEKIGNDVVVSDMRLSPGGKYAYWFDERDSLWRAYNVAGGKRIDLTRGLPAKFFDEEHDTPNLPGAYGAAGWTQNDRYIWLYDRYDIWQIDPTGAEKPRNLTNGWGRTSKIRLRRADLDTEEKDINPTTDLWLTGFWEGDKHTGILKATPPAKGDVAINILAQSPHRYSGLSKAKNASTMTYYRGNFREPINLYTTDTTFAKSVQLTRVNLQQDSIRWGSVELVKWTGTNGTTLEGLLYKPEGFDDGPMPTKKYPMLVYYYERNTETLNDYRAPSPSRSTINIPYCVSNGYLVFVPDIVYTVGQPGPDAYDCVVPGVLSLINRGFVDRDRIGLQGQSWGGYQTAYLVTRTNLFKAAMAGAIVANMTSAYGGIRWGTGLVRQFQYEKTQSRIGGTLWDKPMSYIENSPLFYANRIETPLLLMHNDADGSVPWYQGIEMFTALRRLQKPVWMLVYNGEDHNLVQRYNAKDLSIRLYQFFDHYLKDAPAPAWMTEGRTAVEKERGEMKY